MKRRLLCRGLVMVPALVACSSENNGPRISDEYCNVPPSPHSPCGGGGDAGAGPRESDASPGLTFARSALARDNPLLATPDALRNTTDDAQAFAFELEQKVGETPGNVFMSPFSVETAMAMAWAGAKGATATEILNVFHFGDPAATHGALGALEAAASVDSVNLVFSSANALWVSPTIAPLTPFLDILGLNYGAGVGLVDFGNPANAAAEIDGWVSAKTQGGIPELLVAADLPSPNTVAVLTNAAYFRANWQEPFDPTATQSGSFTRDDGTSAPVKFMSGWPTIPYVSGPDYQAASLAYEGREGHHYEMLVVLPVGAMSDLEKNLSAPWLASLRASLSPTFIDFEMPRFEIRTPLHLKDTLSSMGMPTAFDARKADFTGIAATPPLHLEDVVHQGFLSVDETGTEASAATAVIVGKDASTGPTPTATLHLDRPFLVMIRHVETGVLLFTGRVSRP